MKLATVVGTRPEIIKMQPIMKEIQNKKHKLIFIHTGQHYDFKMSKIFVDELKLSEPDFFLNVGSGSQGLQTGKIISKCEEVLRSEKPDLLLVEGDTNSALGAAIAAAKLGLPIGHVEAGCRSFDKSMPEEINRVLISHIADLHFAPTPNCGENLMKEGIAPSHIFLTGHPIVDLIMEIKSKIQFHHLEKKLGISHKAFALVTVHRRENISDKKRIQNILESLCHLTQKMPVVFPCHPHTRIWLTKFSLNDYLKTIKTIRPVGYFDSLGLIKHARFVLTDSGGIQQEAALLHTPCITIREVTEWVETVRSGINFLSSYKSKQIIKAINTVERKYDDIMRNFNSTQNIFGKVGVRGRIIHTIEKKI